MTDPMTVLHDQIGILGVALARWAERDDTTAQPEVRQAANTAHGRDRRHAGQAVRSPIGSRDRDKAVGRRHRRPRGRPARPDPPGPNPVRIRDHPVTEAGKDPEATKGLPRLPSWPDPCRSAIVSAHQALVRRPRVSMARPPRGPDRDDLVRHDLPHVPRRQVADERALSSGLCR